jgi:isoamylase
MRILTPARTASLLAFFLTAALSLPARAGAIGSNFPSSGAYSEVNPSGWASASWPLGATFTSGPGSTLQVGVYSAHATKMVLEIYLNDTGSDATYDYDMAKGSDNVWRAAVAGIPQHTLYAFRAWGPNWTYSASWARGNSSAGFVTDCDSSGNRFNPNKVLFDPYARELSHNTWTPAMAAAGESYSMYTSGGTNVSSSQTYKGPLSNNTAVDARTVDDGHWAPKSVALTDSTPTGTKPGLAQKDAVIYEAHVKGLTAHPESVKLTTLLSSYSGFQDAANVPDNLRGTYAGAAYMAGYLKDLGFNTIELLPVHETNNADNPSNAPSTSGGGYWSYWTYGFFAPDRAYAHDQSLGGPTAEFKAMVAAFHAAGIEVYLDVVYNHTAEGGVWDSSTAQQAELTFLRGLDNASYYTLVSGTPQFYWVSTGVGTNVNGASAPAAKLITDSLTYWANTMGVDGFRFDEGAELGRNGSSGFSSSAPLLVSIASLASQYQFKIIAEPWDVNDGAEIGNFPPGWACWNGNFRDTARLFLQGIVSTFNSASGGIGYADAFQGTQLKFANEGGPQKSVNFIVCHDGYNMTDVVSYANGPSNLSWPFGPEQEGGNDNNASFGGNQTLRRQVIRGGWTYMVLSRGVPMFLFGDEMGRTVNGNNNSYNIDSVATWNNYAMVASPSPDTLPTEDATGGTMPYDNNLGTFSSTHNSNFAFLQYLLHLRQAHPAFRQGDYTSESITFTNPDGSTFVEAASAAALIYMHGTQVGDDDFLVLANMTASAASYTLPSGPAGTHWAKIIDTNSSSEGNDNCWTLAQGPQVSSTLSVNAQSVVVLESVAPVPAFTIQPLSVTASAGSTVVLAAGASNNPTYQWYLNGSKITGATDALLVLTGSSVQPGSYTCVATNVSGTATSAAATVSVTSTTTPGRLINLSCLGFVGTGANILQAGFVVSGGSGGGSLPVLVRASGPALAQFSVPNLLPDPELTLNNTTDPNKTVVLAVDNGWKGDTSIYNEAKAVGAFSWGSKATPDSAFYETGLSGGSYTAQVAGAAGDTGNGLVEVYDATPSGTYVDGMPRLINLSTLVQIQAGTTPVYDGFVIQGSTARTVLIRATGPTLSAFGLGGLLKDPQLILTNTTGQNVVVATNTGWGADPSIIQVARSVGAFSWGGSATSDSALAITLPPGSYTAGVVGASADAGLALIEVYEVP